jgi:hypothetical protein
MPANKRATRIRQIQIESCVRQQRQMRQQTFPDPATRKLASQGSRRWPKRKFIGCSLAPEPLPAKHSKHTKPKLMSAFVSFRVVRGPTLNHLITS